MADKTNNPGLVTVVGLVTSGIDPDGQFFHNALNTSYTFNTPADYAKFQKAVFEALDALASENPTPPKA